VDGKCHRAVANIGVRPTLADARPEQRFEVHVLDFGGDLYGSEMEVTFAGKLRDEQKFGSLDELKGQIARDVDEARKLFDQDCRGSAT
jgi:riboflavin kinase/FMN adenylyltransferase